jgi:mannan endo-1,4-beta-mannosidase
MRSKLVGFLSLITIFLFSACSSFLFKGTPNYVKVDGDHFSLDGEPYYFVGTNLWYGCYIGAPGKYGDRERLKRELDHLKSVGVTNLRILGASEKSYIKNSLTPAIQIAPGVYDQDLLDGLDFLLSEMHKRNMEAVIFLNNFWEWSGGMAQYNVWAGDGPGVDPANPPNNYPNFMDYSASFYRNTKAKKLFLNYIYMLLTRKNQYDDLYYYEDPTIMAWELANEPRPGREGVAMQWINYYYDWIDSTAMYIHTIDPNHLVTTGSEGLVGSLGDTTVFLNTNKDKYINYLTFHLWPKNWGWFDAKKIDETYPKTKENAINYIDEHIELARELNKPIVMEEFGLPRDSEFYKAGTATTARDRYYKKVLGLIYDSAAAGAPICGSNFWGWGGEGRPQHPDAVWQPGDPFTADPPQEPQGLNSVFDVDSSTIAIFKNMSEKMNSIDLKTKLTLKKN